MKSAGIMLVLMLSSIIVASDSLELKVLPIQDDHIIGIPLYLLVEVKNISDAAVEIPKFENVSIGEIGRGLCKNILTIAGEKPSQEEFSFSHSSSFRIISQLPTQIIKPGKSETTIFNLGIPLKPMLLDFIIECDYYDKKSNYGNHRYTLDHQIHSGKYSSNRIKILVKAPQGKDLEIYNKFIKNRPVGRQETLDIMNSYPESVYSAHLAVKLYTSSSLKDKCMAPSDIDIQSLCRASKNRSRAYLQKQESTDRQNEAMKIRHSENEALEKTVLAHPNCQYSIPLMHVLAQKYLAVEQYTKARYYFKRILIKQPQLEQDVDLIRSSNDFLKYMEKYGL